MDLRHYDGDGRARFVTFGIHRQLPLLTNAPARNEVVAAIRKIRQERYFKLLGYVIMPEHVHQVLMPAENDRLGRLIGEIKRESAVKILDRLIANKSPLLAKLKVVRNGAEKYALWQRRCYDHSCRSIKSVREKINYCHHNPVRRGLVTDPGSWEWSSYRWYCGMADVVLEIDSAEDLF
jgi:putative transposase